jgi:hypothetical protein
MPDLPTLERKLRGVRQEVVRQEVRNLQVLGMRPNYRQKAEFIRRLERSARAEVKLRLKALENAKKDQANGRENARPSQARKP